MKNSLLLILLLLFSACSVGGNYNGNSSRENKKEEIAEDTYSAQQQGYNQGYQDGYSDGYGWRQHGVSYSDRNNYQTTDGISAYKNGYADGYDSGYQEGESKIIAERQEEAKRQEQNNFYVYHNDNGEVWISRSQEEENDYQMMKAREAHYKAMQEEQERAAEEERKRNDFHNWESESVYHFYAEFSAYNDEDAEEKHYFYKKVGDRYFYEINLGYNAYQVEIEYKLDYKFYKLKGSNTFLEFSYEPYLSRWDEGVLDCSGSNGTYYKKP